MSSANTTESFLDEIYETFFSAERVLPRRFVLFADDEPVIKYFQKKDNILTERRLFFEYREDAPETCPALPDGMTLCETDEETVGKIEGRNIPGFSWDDMTEFLSKGRGFCVLDGKTPAAWAFSAAVSGEEIDIGVETAPEYRRRGLAAAVVNEMIRYIIRQGKRPVWSCRSENEGSRRLAEVSGFVMTGKCLTIKTREG